MSIYRPTREQIFKQTEEYIKHSIQQMSRTDLEDAIAASASTEQLLTAIKIDSMAMVATAIKSILHDYYQAGAKSAAIAWANDVEADEKLKHGYHTLNDKRLGANYEHDYGHD